MLTFIETKLFTRLVQNYFTERGGQHTGAILEKIEEELDGKV